MSVSIQQDWVAGRRLYLLRYMEEVGGSALESLIMNAMMRAFDREGRGTILRDIDHLVAERCLEEEHITTGDGATSLRKLTLTVPRGEDAAYGRGDPVPGVQHSRWKR
ncbi:hypothetical protein [Nitrospirillum amazonense]|uniref:hypothetical protein n=1 Tax=Nitrospirillum amazonense TaxID=28077 RepID=UPI0024128DE0|nr:hypothetical protein [Nitrospirillum amazonense]MDG3442432.1 hypothetical protein [Nitrospirillum amazonense]